MRINLKVFKSTYRKRWLQVFHFLGRHNQAGTFIRLHYIRSKIWSRYSAIVASLRHSSVHLLTSHDSWINSVYIYIYVYAVTIYIHNTVYQEQTSYAWLSNAFTWTPAWPVALKEGWNPSVYSHVLSNPIYTIYTNGQGIHGTHERDGNEYVKVSTWCFPTCGHNKAILRPYE